MADAPTLPNQIAEEFKAHRTEFDLENALWNGDVANLERWPDWSAAGIDANMTGLLDIASRAEAVPTTGTLERSLVEAVAFSARADAAILEIRPQLRYRGLATLAARKHVALDIKAPPAGRSGFTPLWPLYKVEHTIAQLGRWRRLSRCYEGSEASARAWLEVASVGYLAWRAAA